MLETKAKTYASNRDGVQQDWVNPQYWMQTWLAVWWPALPRDGVDNGSGRLVNTRRGTGGYVSMSSNEFFK